MTDNEKQRLRQNAAAMLAWADDKPVQWVTSQCNPDYGGGGTWDDEDHPKWRFSEFDYRPKPEPQMRDWNCPEDVPLNCWIRGVSKFERFISTIHSEGGCTDTGGSFAWSDLRDYHYSTTRRKDDWHPCKVVI